MTELVAAINRDELPEATSGVYPFDLTEIDPENYALLPRNFADNKSVEAVALGAMFPQILGYFQVYNTEGKILAYQRKGKEKGLFGKWSIGVGGHVSQDDLAEVYDATGDSYVPLPALIYAGALREVEEELGVPFEHFEVLNGVDDFIEAANRIIISNADVTSSVHVGLPLDLHLIIDDLKLDPAEFCNYAWLNPEDLKSGDREWETWSKLLIESM